MKKFIFSEFAGLKAYSWQLYYQINSFTGIFWQHFKAPPPPHAPPMYWLKPPFHVLNTCGKPWGDFFTGWREPEEYWLWWFEPFSKLKTAFCDAEYQLKSPRGGGIKIWWGECTAGNKQIFSWCRGEGSLPIPLVGKTQSYMMHTKDCYKLKFWNTLILSISSCFMYVA